jgi:transketolase
MEKVSEQIAANAIRALAMDAVEAANSGHPGMPMGMADLAQVLWTKHLKHHPNDPLWVNRDRFVLSNGHGSMLLYAVLHLTGYPITIQDLKSFRQLHAKTAGHPEFDPHLGIEMTTGPLGQGLATAVGMALAEKMLVAKFNQPELPIIDHYTYVFAGDGDLMEGISHEACSLAGTWNLNKLIVIWDDNKISIDGDTKNWMTTNVPERFKAYGWHVIEKVDGHDSAAIDQAIAQAKANQKGPTIICAQTHIGFGSPNRQDTAKAHGAALGEAELKATKKSLGWSYAPFEIPESIYDSYDAKEAGALAQKNWQALWQSYQTNFPELADQLQTSLKHELPGDFSESLESFLVGCIEEKPALATRQASAKVIGWLSEQFPNLCGGSADLTGSNGTAWPAMKSLNPHEPNGFDANYIHYGVREFGMSAIMNGLQLHGGFRTFGGTFLTFSDYARPAIRLSALMKNPVIYVYTHDSIGLGEDGPTHQPVEHVDSLRLIPHLHVWRPADLVETSVAWANAMSYQGPSVMCLSRQKVPALVQNAQLIEDCKKGAYILKDTQNNPSIILFATGTEVSLALEAADLLTQQGHGVRVVSVPCMEVFFRQPKEYQDKVLSKKIKKRASIEAGSSALWAPFVGSEGIICGVNDFGLSGPYQEIYEYFELTPQAIAKKLT